MATNANVDIEEKQCRICFDGPDPVMGRLIRPCLCKGSVKYVHVKCLQRWRNTSPNSSAFFSCPQCKYRYHFGRTRVVGIATNPVVVGVISSTLFMCIVFFSSFITTYFMSAFDEWESESTAYISSYYWINPYDVARDLVRAALRILKDRSGLGFIDHPIISKPRRRNFIGPELAPPPPGYIKWFFTRIFLGLPVVGASSLVQLLMSMPMLGPVQWLARYRGNRRRDDSRDIAAFVIVILLIIGAIRALYKVYELTESLTKRVLLRAEDAILEVSS